ncbi:UNVERIFIED_CONTAM: hypothetical protein FKN15_070119 [Acipenser sinensis]
MVLFWGCNLQDVVSPSECFCCDAGFRLTEMRKSTCRVRTGAGIPFEGGLRALCWKILLNYLPTEQAIWDSFLKKQREIYTQFLREMIIQPGIAKANLGFSREDVTLEDHQEQNIKPQYFTFRWLTLLLSQEFLLPDVIRIWDSLFSDQERFDFLILVCCAMLVLIRDQLLAGDFTVNMRLLQDYPICDVHTILKKAKDLQDSA